MPIDWNAVQATPGSTPDTSIIKGIPASPLPSVDTVSAGGIPTHREVPPLDYNPTPDAMPYTPDYSFLQGIQAGLHDTALGALWHAFDTPDFDFDSTFTSSVGLANVEKATGRQFDDNSKAKLLATGSQAEFDYQLQRILDNQERAEMAGQELAGYLAGSIIDIDLLAGGAVGKIPAVARASTAARASVRASTVGGVSAGAYLSDTHTPMSPEAIAFQISAMTAGSLLIDVLSKPKKVAPVIPEGN